MKQYIYPLIGLAIVGLGFFVYKSDIVDMNIKMPSFWQKENLGVLKYVPQNPDILYSMRLTDSVKEYLSGFASKAVDGYDRDLIEGVDSIVLTTLIDEEVSVTIFAVNDSFEIEKVKKMIASQSGATFERLEDRMFAVGSEKSISYIKSMTGNIIDNKQMKQYIDQNDILYVGGINQQLAVFEKALNNSIKYFAYGLTIKDGTTKFNIDIVLAKDLNISQDYNFKPIKINNFDKDTIYAIVELGPIAQMFNISEEYFKDTLRPIIQSTNNPIADMISNDDLTALYSVFDNNIVFSINNANNIFDIGGQITLGDERLWQLIKKLSPMLKNYAYLMYGTGSNASGSQLDYTEEENKINISYQLFDFTAQNKYNRTVLSIFNPITNTGQNDVIFSKNSLASIFWNPKKTFEIANRLGTLYGTGKNKSTEQLQNILGAKEFFGDIRVVGNVIMMRFVNR